MRPMGASIKWHRGIFSDFWRRATRCRQKSKKMLLKKINETVAFFPIFGGALRAAAKNRKKCLMKPWHFFRFLAACYALPPKIEKNAEWKNRPPLGLTPPLQATEQGPSQLELAGSCIRTYRLWPGKIGKRNRQRMFVKGWKAARIHNKSLENKI